MKKFNEDFRRFADQTPIHGVSYIYSTKKPIISIIWASLLFIAVCLAVNDMSNIVHYYLTEPTGVAVDVRSNENVTIPNPTVCIEFGYLHPEEFQFETFHADVDAFLQATQNGMNLAIERYEQLNITKSLEFYTYMMLAYITDFELYYTGEQHYQFQRMMATDYIPNYNSWNMSDKLQIVYDTYMARNVPLINLKKLVGMSICQQRHLYMENYRYPNDEKVIRLPLCEASMITHLGFSLVCSKMFKTAQFRLDDAQFNKFSIKKAGSYDSDDYQQKPYKTMNGDGVFANWYVDFQGRSILPPVGDRSSVLSVPVDNKEAFDVFISAEYQYFNGKQRPCGTGQAECQLQKRAELMQKSCGCWSSSLVSPANSSKVQSCSENPSNPIGNVTSDFLKFRSCDFALSYLANLDAQCQRDCQLFSFTIAARDSMFYFNDYSFFSLPQEQSFVPKLPLSPLEFDLRVDCMREVYVESTIKTWTTFVSDVGGSIGTWLGGSLLAFIHIPLFMCESCYNCQKKQQTGTCSNLNNPI